MHFELKFGKLTSIYRLRTGNGMQSKTKQLPNITNIRDPNLNDAQCNI